MTKRFDVYRYQILPINRNLQKVLFDFNDFHIETIDDLIAKKNDIFEKILLDICKQETLKDKSKQYKISLLSYKKESRLLIAKIAPKRKLTRENENFEKEEIDNWPSVMIVFWNHPEKQALYIEHKTTAFESTKRVAKILEKILRKRLKHYQLTLFIEPVTKEEAFWSVIEKYHDKIYSIKFDLITPNMANISESLSEDLKNLAKSTNSIKTDVSIKADRKSHLDITKDNPYIKDLTGYVSKGGGECIIKVKGLKKKIKTSETVQSIEIDDLTITSSPETVLLILDKVLQ